MEKNKYIDHRGYLRINIKNGTPQYYLTERNSGSEKREISYISKSNMHLIKGLAQRDYDKQVISCTEKWIHWLDKAILRMPKKRIEDIIDDKNRYGYFRRNLIRTYTLSDDEYIETWKQKKYKGKPFPEDTPEIFAEQGHRVRSKSEKIISDKLHMLGIPYRYECPVILDTGMMVYPDFTILNVRERKEYYLEHFGMMDNYEYCNKTVLKIGSYAKSGILLGQRLFATFETSTIPLDVNGLGELLKAFCL